MGSFGYGVGGLDIYVQLSCALSLSPELAQQPVAQPNAQADADGQGAVQWQHRP